MASPHSSAEGSGAPLSSRSLRSARLDVPRHDRRQVTACAASFGLAAEGKHPPVVSTTMIPVGTKGGRTRWEVQIDVRNALITAPTPPRMEPVLIKAAQLRRLGPRPLGPSMPDDGGQVAVQPRLLRDTAPLRLHYGDLEYEATTIFPPDGRRSYYDTRYPWRCLCRIQTSTGSGSGVLIGPRHVLTASHAVDWFQGFTTVAVLERNGVALDRANAIIGYASVHLGPGKIGDSDSDEDYAVLVLDKPLGQSFGWFGCRTYDSGWDDETSAWRNIGYPADRGWGAQVPVYQRDFFLNELGADYGSARLIRSDTFDNWPGQSGGPVFGFWPDGPYVVGVVSGQGDDYNYISGGSLLTSLVSKARSDHP